MKKRTHLIFAALFFLVLNAFFSFPLLFVVFALIGAIFPDLDLLFMRLHRKALHNIWVLIAVVFAGLQFALMDRSIALAFSIGFLSHLIADGATPMGVKPFWPIPMPHIKGPIRTGGALEYVLVVVLLLAIGYVTGIVQLRFVI